MTIEEASQTMVEILNQYPELCPEVIQYASTKLRQWFERINEAKQSYNERVIALLATWCPLTDEYREQVQKICERVYPLAKIQI